ncbi:anthranilate/para-aminobenzoate synthase component I [Pyrinomonas methylaliphatogenes]|uniref:Anthranilate synthase component 1 n=2 Tax=Pyrinomonas methylaliphatogenes TaxID=454194 RepID=A0A0B6WXC5_9BACT|nr:anthranilate/para-aminobenzoate synthase component I [Pyrinomonas methylaliphatogenes]
MSMYTIQPASFEEFLQEAERGNVVPVVRTVLADLQTPVSAFLRIAADARHAFLLESVEGGERIARYSFLGAHPEMIVRGRGNATIIERAEGTERFEGVRVVDFLRDYFRAKRLARRSGLAPFAGGAVGFLAYDAARWFEPVLDSGEDPETDDAALMFYRTVLAFDRVRQQIVITTVVFTDEAGGDRRRLRELYEEAVAETERMERKLGENLPPKSARKGPGRAADPLRLQSNWTREGFQQAVQRAREYIYAGDCYQVVLSQRFMVDVVADPVEIYRALRVLNPSPYMFFLRFDREAVVGASPEMLVRCRGQRLDYRPIAGTRKRGATETEDWLLGEEMRADEKEVAEHMMLVDLGRNDLGRVADFGSVEITDLMTIEKYSHVQHLVTGLRARLRDDLDRFDALASCFPAGTVTGAPKVRAMQIIRELEPDRRGIYAGTVFYADYADNLDSCIAIRTMHLRDGRAEVQAGAGIVADSVPEREYEESVNKASALLRAIEWAEQGL